MTTLEKIYQPDIIETKWYKNWEHAGYFRPTNHGDAYCIMLPPPNVTGSLHMGHGFGCTLMDVLIRYHRMMGDNTLWQAGVDHAGIATQMVVERRLNLQGKTRHDLGREAFVEEIWAWKEESGGQIVNQLRRLGASLDWTRERFTFDADFSHAVRDVFIKLYEEGLIYQGERLVNWDPQLLTAISDLEVTSEEEDGKLWHIRYPVVGENTQVVVATTRPETMLGDVAVAVHPDDERYTHLIGKSLQLPLTDKTIPIIADTYVDPLFGSGCVKITPAHDFNDYQIGLNHGLKPINIFTPQAKLNEMVPVKYQGMDRFAARKAIIEDLEAAGLLIKVDPHKMKIPRGERSGVIVEPYLTKQWFMKMKPLAQPAIDAVMNEEIKFIPDNWRKTYFQWMENIEDWCISRQLWWGHRIPVWYDTEGNAYAGQNEEDVRLKHNLKMDVHLKQDDDVLDTWFSAALWPFATLGWPKQTSELATFFPTNVLVTGFDIIFFWVARMIMMSLKFTEQVPFREVYITGLIRDADGQKMSKSKGNVLDPIDLIDGIALEDLVKKRTYALMQPKMAEKIEKRTQKEYPEGIPSYGTDALRFTFCSVASYTREIRFDTHRLAGYRNFCNKLWNAARYVLMNTEGHPTGFQHEEKKFSLADLWILSSLQNTIEAAHFALKTYRFDLFAQKLYEFTWNEFCDWYLELSKPILVSEHSDPALKCGTRYTLTKVLETLLRLLHPIMPFITEEIWQRIAPLAAKTGPSILLEPYPQKEQEWIDANAEQEINWLKTIVVAIRTIRSEMNISPAKRVNILLHRGTNTDKKYESNNKKLLMTLAKIDSITWMKANDTPPPAASAFLGELEVYIPLADLIDKNEELNRINKEIGKIEKEMLAINGKLANPNFVEKAPAAVVEKEKARQLELNTTLNKLNEQKQNLANL